MKNLILKNVSTDSTQVSYADTTTSLSVESNQINVERETYLKDSYEVSNEMEFYSTIDHYININEEENLQNNSQKEIQENPVISSTFSPYGYWAEKRRQACERHKNQQMGRELKLQETVEMRHNQLQQEVKRVMENVGTIMAMKEKAELNEVSSVTSSSSKPYGDWAEKRKQACYLQSLQKTKIMDREHKMQERVEKYRNRLKEELIREMKTSVSVRDNLHRVESCCEENSVTMRDYMHKLESS